MVLLDILLQFVTFQLFIVCCSMTFESFQKDVIFNVLEHVFVDMFEHLGSFKPFVSNLLIEIPFPNPRPPPVSNFLFLSLLLQLSFSFRKVSSLGFVFKFLGINLFFGHDSFDLVGALFSEKSTSFSLFLVFLDFFRLCKLDVSNSQQTFECYQFWNNLFFNNFGIWRFRIFHINELLTKSRIINDFGSIIKEPELVLL